jgi:translation initiation factor eIF-2B subunit epsilon
VANIQLELNALRLGTNATEHQVRRAVTQAFMKYISQLVDSGTPAKAAVNNTLPKFKSLLERTMFDKADDDKPDQVDFMLSLQTDAVSRKDGDLLLLHVATKLVELDVIDAEGIEQWWDDAKSSADEGMQKVRSKTQQLVEYLRESDEESGEDDDDESD